MKLILMIIYFLILFVLVKLIDKLNVVFGRILSCSEKVKAKHEGFVSKNHKIKRQNPYAMCVSYEFEGKHIKTLLLDDYPLAFYGRHASSGDQEVYIDPKKPGRAVLFKTRMVVKYSIFYAILVVLSVADIILIATSIFK